MMRYSVKRSKGRQRTRKEKITPEKRQKSRGKRAQQTIGRRSRPAAPEAKELRRYNDRPIKPATKNTPARSSVTPYDVASSWPKKESKKR